MKREAVAMWIQKHVQCGYKSTCADRKLKKWATEYKDFVAVRIQNHVHRDKAQKAQKYMQCVYRSMCIDRKLIKWAIEYKDLVVEAFPLSMKSILSRVSSC